MPFGHNISHKEKASTAYKEKLLKDLEYYDRRLKEFRKTKILSNNSYDSSDSDSDLPICKPLEPTQDMTDLLNQRDNLKTCLNATQELTGLTVLESEISILSEDPVFADKLSLEPGLWREVLAECRVDLVPISITFFMHQPHRKFAPPSFHALRVVPVKAAHEIELNSSVLHKAKTPSEIYEVIKNYATASRSRRSTLSKLAELFPTTLFMEPLDGGGYKLKCADLVEICWRLNNDASTVAPFHHKFKFDLEYLDESHLKRIKECYKQLSYPKLETDERTLLLAEIIKICLDAKSIEEVNNPREVPEVEDVPEVDVNEQGETNMKQKNLPRNQINKTEKDIKQRKRKENQDPNSKEIKKKANLKGSDNTQKKSKEGTQMSAEDKNRSNEKCVTNLQKGNDVGKKLVDVDDNRQISKDTKKVVKKKPSEGQKINNIQRNEVSNDKGIENERHIAKVQRSEVSKEVTIENANIQLPVQQNVKKRKVTENVVIENVNMKHSEVEKAQRSEINKDGGIESENVKPSEGQKLKTVQRSEMNKDVEGTNVKTSEVQKIKTIQRSEINEVKATESTNVKSSKGQKTKTVQKSEINKDVEGTNVKTSEVQKIKTIQRSEINEVKATENTNVKSSKGQKTKTVQQSETNKDVAGTNVKTSEVQKIKTIQRSEINEVKATESANVKSSKGQKTKTVQQSEINKDVEGTNLKTSEVQKIKTNQRSEINEVKATESANVKSSKGQKTKTVQQSEINKDVESNNEKTSEAPKIKEIQRTEGSENIENKNKKQNDNVMHKKSIKVTSQDNKSSKEIHREKILKRKAENTNKQTEVKKTKTTEIMEVDKNVAASKKSKVTKEKENIAKNNPNVTKNIAKANEGKTVTKTQSKIDSQKDLIRLNENEMPIEEYNLDLFSNQSENIRNIAVSDKNIVENNKVLKNIVKNKNLKMLEITKKHTTPKNNLKDTKSSKTQIKDGITKNFSKPQSTERVDKNNSNVDNPEPSISVASSKVNSFDSKEIINGLIEYTNNKTVEKVVGKNQILKNTANKASKIIASSQNKNVTNKTVFKDRKKERVLGSKGPGKNNFQKVITNKISNLNLHSKFKKLSPGNIAQNGDTSRIPQKKMSPNLKNAMKSQLRKSPRNLPTSVKRVEKLVSNIPRIIKAARPHH